MEAWNNYTIYPKGYEVLNGNEVYVSIIDENLNNLASSTAHWKKKDIRLENDQKFGLELYYEFLEISRGNNLNSGNKMSLIDSRLIRDRLKYLIDFAIAGDILQMEDELIILIPDSLFPLSLKNYFLAKIASYLSQY